MSFKKSIDKVVRWAEKRGWRVFFYTDAPEVTIWTYKQIHINSRAHPETRLYTLLHECGHILVDDNRDRIHRLSFESHGEDIYRPERRKRVAVVSEEYEAWKRGERLARRMGIEIDVKKFDRHRSVALMSYINWASD
jgi:hypothetical protein